MPDIKYIVVKGSRCAEDVSPDTEFPILFPKEMTHRLVANRVRGTVVGAGFAVHDGDEWCAYGRSESCNVDSRMETDSKLLNKFFGSY